MRRAPVFGATSVTLDETECPHPFYASERSRQRAEEKPEDSQRGGAVSAPADFRQRISIEFWRGASRGWRFIRIRFQLLEKEFTGRRRQESRGRSGLSGRIVLDLGSPGVGSVRGPVAVGLAGSSSGCSALGRAPASADGANTARESTIPACGGYAGVGRRLPRVRVDVLTVCSFR